MNGAASPSPKSFHPHTRHGLHCPSSGCRRKEALYVELLPQLKPVPEVLEPSKDQYRASPSAVVSGSTAKLPSEASLSTLHPSTASPLSFAPETTTTQKPHPEPFLLAAAKLGVPPQSCLSSKTPDHGHPIRHRSRNGLHKVPPPSERS